ncbi:HAAS signaling domain-containing protein [Saccharopolyspora sp. 5N708]|uniref:HAAS signaling domain-containing protein n=1 Tax=Saccharopolyspora sp. 5N708 TaxID=3457424 RepID=UPI003FCF41ED
MMVLDKKYHDELLLALRMHEISGERVGEVLAEVEAHVAETGEDPVEAFGQPREYARKVAAQLDRNTGKRSTLDIVVSGLVMIALTILGSDWLLDGLFEETPVLPYTLKDAVALSAVLVFGVLGALLLGRGVTAGARNEIYVFAGIGSFVLMIVAQPVIGWTVDDVSPLYELPRWLAIGLGAVLMAGAIGMLVHAYRRGRVVYPKTK